MLIQSKLAVITATMETTNDKGTLAASTFIPLLVALKDTADKTLNPTNMVEVMISKDTIAAVASLPNTTTMSVEELKAPALTTLIETL